MNYRHSGGSWRVADVGETASKSTLAKAQRLTKTNDKGALSLTNQYTSGADALNALTATNEGNGSQSEFSSFKSGSSFRVRALGTADLMVFRSYGVFKQVNSFVAKEPSVYSAKGFPQSNLTTWDKASEYYSKQAFETEDEKTKTDLRNEAYKYRGKERFALGFIDLDTGTPVIVDLSKKQALAVHAVLKKNESKLDKKAFELEKSGSGTSTQVLLSPIDLDELNDKQSANFEKFNGQAFDHSLFNGILYEADEAEQLKFLTQAGFDIALIGASKTEVNGSNEAAGADIAEEELPF